MENKKINMLLKITKEQDGYLKVNVDNYGVTWAKNLEDVGVAISEMIQATEKLENRVKDNYVKFVK